MSASGATAGLGLFAAASWGGSDFVGGLGARRSSALLVTASGQIASLFALLALCLFLHLNVPAGQQLLYSAVGGFEGALALAIFYRALAMGAMGLTAALTGLFTALVPTVYSIAHDGLPAPLTTTGLAAGCVAIWLITHRPLAANAGIASATPPKALLLGSLAGIGFGSQLILFKIAGAGGILWITAAARAAGVAALLLLLLVLPPKRPWRGF
jgi:uncharacterized membrane protein